ncbi:MAG: TMEM198/TM7SF3 family protein [Clostridiales bacterium]|nr:TMEM198/TM7SF3 family protein [Clostridiales bacterium]
MDIMDFTGGMNSFAMIENAIYSFIYSIQDIVETIGAVIIILGLINAFLGYKIFKVTLAISGFFVGALVGVIIFIAANADSLLYASFDGMIWFVLIGAIAGALFAMFFHKVAVFLTIWTFGALAFTLITQNEQMSLVLGLICGIVGVIVEKYVIIATTAFAGGYLVSAGFWLFGAASLEFNDTRAVSWVVAILGIVFQFWLELKKSVGKEGKMVFLSF